MSREAGIGAGLLDATLPAPAGLSDGRGRPAVRRYDVYRNNVAATLTEALEVSFPTVRALVGERFFRAMAGVHLRAHPPKTPRLMLYGEGFASFVETFPPAAGLPYLGDVARLELALRESYHAADAEPIAADRLGAIAPEALEAVRLELAPSLRLLRPRHAALAIWQAHHGGPKPDMAAAPPILVTRPGYDPRPHAIEPAAADCLAALMDGAPLGVAAGRGGAGLDLAKLLELLLREGAVTGLR